MEIVIGIISVIIAFLTYQKTFHSKPPEPIEEKENLFINYKLAQNLSLQVQKLIEEHINKNNAGQLEMFPNITFQKYLDIMKSEYEKCLSDKLYEDLKKLPLTKSAIETMMKSLNEQSNALTQIKNQILFLVN